MNILVIPDIHLKTWIFDRAEEILDAGKAERAVCLMDMPDDWNKQFLIEAYQAVYDRGISFAAKYPDTLWCYGNHDVCYLWGKRETGYSPLAEHTVIQKLRELERSLCDPSQIRMIHRIDNVLFSHAGLTTDYVEWLDENLLTADIDEVLSAVNKATHEQLWNYESPIWIRPQQVKRVGFRDTIYKQVVGHTPVEQIGETGAFISTDVFSTHRDGTQIGESAMVVIDSITCEYVKVRVKGQ